jgi:beta-glucosidase
MASFSSWGGSKMHANHYLLTEVLKDELGFQGFVVSDWQAVDQVAEDYYAAVVASINAGVDMNMVPFDYKQFISTLTKAVEQGDVPETRVDDAVARILRTKLALNLFARPFPEDDSTAKVGALEHRDLARQAVSESLVLLKNEGGMLPLDSTAEGILVGGGAAVSVGLQSGGWTIEWQGKDGDITPGTTFMEALQVAASPQTLVAYNRFGRFDELVEGQDAAGPAEIGIVVIAEQPYAEGLGDRADLTLSDEDRELIARVAAQSERTLLMLFSGRPLIITEELDMVDACVAAWLPGSEAQGITDVLFGDRPFTGKLSFNWPRSMAQVPTGQGGEPLFPIGYGLTTS